MRAELTRYAVPGWGEGELWTRGHVVLAHDFRFDAIAAIDATAAAPLGEAEPPSGTVTSRGAREGHDFVKDVRRPAVADDLVPRFTAFLSGAAVGFDDVELERGSETPFQDAVTAALRSVPRGEVVTYGELAALAGYPGAQRAVGTFCARNRFMILLPCHRVVGAHGIGAYGSDGVAVKRRLLALEGVSL